MWCGVERCGVVWCGLEWFGGEGVLGGKRGGRSEGGWAACRQLGGADEGSIEESKGEDDDRKEDQAQVRDDLDASEDKEREGGHEDGAPETHLRAAEAIVAEGRSGRAEA